MTLSKTLSSLFTLMLLGAAGCGGANYETLGEAPARGADASIELSDASSGNRRVRIEVEHLAPPARVSDGSQRYSVWLIPPGRDPVLAGTLQYDEGTRRGELETLTPYPRFELLVTAERSRTPRHPSRAVVLEQRVGS